MTDAPTNGFGLPLARPAAPAAAPVATPTIAAAPVPAPAPVAVPTLVAEPAVAAVPAEAPGRRIMLDDLLAHVLEVGASDLHLTQGAPPTVRLRGEMEAIEGYGVLSGEQLRIALYGIMTERQRKVFEEELELDFSYAVPGSARFRVNIFQQRDQLGAVMRMIPWEIKPLEDLGMPNVLASFAEVGSSRVDLQACKLEYSIVSPK